ncbi:MAG: M15 family metallopeptidase [Deltaproteobacteria bacterium]|nr:M15 family metallopeptidase [Deltaproteobacteria bacterium]
MVSTVHDPASSILTPTPSLFPNDIVFLQRLLRQAGHYQGAIDGKFGAGSDKALQAFMLEYQAIRDQLGSFDSRSEATIRTLLPPAQRAARQFLGKGNQALGGGLTVRLLSGSRTYQEQNDLYAKGRTKPGSIVTKAKGGQSNHNFGIAFDAGIFDGSVYLDGNTQAELKRYVDLAKAARGKLEWGGDWKSFKDLPHYQLALGLSIKELRSRFESGAKIV